MKKIYISPVTAIVNVEVESVMTSMSLPTAGDSMGVTDERGNASNQGAAGLEGSWDNIWVNM